MEREQSYAPNRLKTLLSANCIDWKVTRAFQSQERFAQKLDRFALLTPLLRLDLHLEAVWGGARGHLEPGTWTTTKTHF